MDVFEEKIRADSGNGLLLWDRCQEQNLSLTCPVDVVEPVLVHHFCVYFRGILHIPNIHSRECGKLESKM